MNYDQFYLDWKSDPEKFWQEKAESLVWFKKWEKVLKKSILILMNGLVVEKSILVTTVLIDMLMKAKEIKLL
jgi:hypothetical protein